MERRTENCYQCNGLGIVYKKSGATQACFVCGGSGMIEVDPDRDDEDDEEASTDSS